MSTTIESTRGYGLEFEIEVYRGSSAMDDPSDCRLVGATWSDWFWEYQHEIQDDPAAPWWSDRPVVGQEAPKEIIEYLWERYGDDLSETAWDHARGVA